MPSLSPSVTSRLATEPVGRLNLQPVVFRLCHRGNADQHGVPAVHRLQLLPHLEAVSCSLIGHNSTCQETHGHFLLTAAVTPSHPHQAEGRTGSSNGTSFLEVLLPQEVLWFWMTCKMKAQRLKVVQTEVQLVPMNSRLTSDLVGQSGVVPDLHTSPPGGWRGCCCHTCSTITRGISVCCSRTSTGTASCVSDQ